MRNEVGSTVERLDRPSAYYISRVRSTLPASIASFLQRMPITQTHQLPEQAQTRSRRQRRGAHGTRRRSSCQRDDSLRRQPVGSTLSTRTFLFPVTQPNTAPTGHSTPQKSRSTSSSPSAARSSASSWASTDSTRPPAASASSNTTPTRTPSTA